MRTHVSKCIGEPKKKFEETQDQFIQLFDKEGEPKKYYKCLKWNFYESFNIYDVRKHVIQCKGESKKKLKKAKTTQARFTTIKIIYSSAERDQLNEFATLNPVTNLTTEKGFSYS